MLFSQFALNWIAFEFMLVNSKHRQLMLTRPFAARRKFHAIGVSMHRSGTNSLAGIFSRYRTIREQTMHFGEMLYVEGKTRRISRAKQIASLRFIDACLGPEMSSGGSMGDLVDALIEAFPRARFILPIRDPYSWLNTFMAVTQDKQERNIQPRPITFVTIQPHLHPHPPQEEILRQNQVWSLDGFLSYWARHNQTVIDSVPPDRLLALRLDELSSSGQRIAEFLDIDPTTLSMDRSYLHRKSHQSPLLREIDRDHLEARVEHHCRPLLDRFFPEIKSMDDAFPR